MKCTLNSYQPFLKKENKEKDKKIHSINASVHVGKVFFFFFNVSIGSLRKVGHWGKPKMQIACIVMRPIIPMDSLF